jgi:hypothetical protein
MRGLAHAIANGTVAADAASLAMAGSGSHAERGLANASADGAGCSYVVAHCLANSGSRVTRGSAHAIGNATAAARAILLGISAMAA